MISRRRGHRRQASVRLVEQGLTLNIDQLVKARFLIPGSRTSGRIDWSFRGQPAGAVRYESQLALPNACLRLYFTVSDPVRGGSHSMEQEIRLTTTRPRFGGARWWFVCPQSGARVGRLHLPPGSLQFAARRAHGLRYACQSETASARATRRAWKLIAKLGGETDCYSLPLLPLLKPKRMRWSTYSKTVNQLLAFETVALRLMVIATSRIAASGTEPPLPIENSRLRLNEGGLGYTPTTSS